MKYKNLEDALVDNPGPLIVQLDRNMLLGRQYLMYLKKPGATPRSKPIDILGGVLVADEGDTHSDMLRILAGALERANEIRANPSGESITITNSNGSA